MSPAYAHKLLPVEALNNTSIINRVMDTVVGVWDLEDTHERAPESLLSYNYRTEGPESVIDNDERQKVDPSDFAEGGKYRSIVKLMCHYEGFENEDTWSMGTGWLIAPDLLVTAGHCSYDWTHKLGKLTKVKAFIGYNGKDSVDLPITQFRSGKRVACPAEWLKGPTRTYDVSFILVDKPFTGIKPIKYADTPAKGSLALGVVGYPGDLDHGEHMYEHFLDAKFDLAANDKMLTYKIDTYGGNSGSAVLRQKDLVSIGVHAYGGTVNQASVIGPLGNVFSDYITAIRSTVNGPKTHQGIHFQTVPTNGTTRSHNGHNGQTGHDGYNGQSTGSHIVTRTILKSPSQINNELQGRRGGNTSYSGSNGNGNYHGAGGPEEGFIDDVGDFLKKGVRISAPIIGDIVGVAAPMFLGPLGAPIGCITSIAFGAVGRMCAESMVEGESAPALDGLAERAVMGEAALQVIMKMDKQTLHEEGLFDVMSTVIRTLGPIFRKAAPHVLNTIMPTVLNVAVTALGQANGSTESFEDGSSEFEAAYIQLHQHSNIRYTSAATESFGDEFIASAASTGATEEGFIDFFVKKALSVGTQLVKKGLPVLIDYFTSTESFDGSPAPATPMDGLVERAVLQEAALQALMTLPPQRLQEEGFIDTMGDLIKRLAPVVINQAPQIIKAITSVVQTVVAAETGAPESGAGRQNGAKAMRKKKSMQWKKGGNEESFMDKYQNWAGENPNSGSLRPRVSVASY